MEEDAVVTLEVDISQAEKGIVKVTKNITDLKKTAGEISSIFSSAFDPLIEKIGDVADRMGELTGSITTASQMLENYFGQLSIEPATEAFAGTTEGITSINELLGATIEGSVGAAAGAITGALIPKISEAVIALGSALNISTGGAAALVAAAVVALVSLIALVVTYWDEISYFFTDTLPGFFSDAWNFHTETVPEFYSNLPEVFNAIAATLPEPFREVAMEIAGLFSDCWYGIEELWNGAALWFQENVIQPIIDFFAPVFEWFGEISASIQQVVSDVSYNIQVLVDGCKAIIAQWIHNLCDKLVEGIRNIRDKVKEMFAKVADFFGGIFSDAWAKITSIFSLDGTAFGDFKDGLLSSFKKIVNDLIDGINAVVKKPFEAINTAIVNLRDANILGITPFANLKTITVPQIPYLAQGAVLPANKPFLAVVGDQKHGTNVEAPLDTIKQAVAEVLAGQGGGDVVINFTGDLAQLARVLKPVIDRENRRVGGSLAKGVV